MSDLVLVDGNQSRVRVRVLNAIVATIENRNKIVTGPVGAGSVVNLVLDEAYQRPKLLNGLIRNGDIEIVDDGVSLSFTGVNRQEATPGKPGPKPKNNGALEV